MKLPAFSYFLPYHNAVSYGCADLCSMEITFVSCRDRLDSHFLLHVLGLGGSACLDCSEQEVASEIVALDEEGALKP